VKRSRVLLTALVTVVLLPGLAAGGDYEVVDVESSGRIVGRISFEGTPPPIATLPVTTDNETCGTEKPSRT